MINPRVGGGKDKDDDDERILRIKIYVTADKRQARTFSSECIIQGVNRAPKVLNPFCHQGGKI